MAKRRISAKRGDAIADRITDLIIVQLSLAGVKQHAIRKIVGGGMARVVNISKAVKAARRAGKGT